MTPLLLRLELSHLDDFVAAHAIVRTPSPLPPNHLSDRGVESYAESNEKYTRHLPKNVRQSP